MARHFRGFPSQPLIRPFRLLHNAFYDTVAESGTAAETLTNAATFASTLAETGSATDTSSSAAVFSSSISEAGSASDTVTGGLLLTDSASESASAADTTSAAAVFASSNSESGSASDTSSALAVFASTQSESGTAADTDSASVVFGPTLSESGSSSDTIAAAAVFGSTNSETLAAADSDSGAATFASSLAETATAADTAAGTVVHGGVPNILNSRLGAFGEFAWGQEIPTVFATATTTTTPAGGPAFPYPRRGKELRHRLGRGRSLRDICDELEREIAEPVIKLAPDLDQFAGEYFGHQIDELREAIDEFAQEQHALDDYRAIATEVHARALLRRLEDEEHMCAVLLLATH